MKKVIWLALICAAPLVFSCSKRKSAKNEFPVLGRLAPANQYFKIHPGQKNILRAEKGSYFTIEADCFALPAGYAAGDKIEIHIIEATRSLEFAALPVSLEFKRDGKDTLFESAGMFYIAASYKEQPLPLQKGKKIHVKFRTKVSGDKFHVYNYDADKGWQRHGHNREVIEHPGLMAQAMGSEASDSKPVVVGGAGDKVRSGPLAISPAKPRVGDAKVSRVRAALYREYEIDSLTWWNFDYPKPTLTCLKGKITGSDSDYFSVTVFSKSELGAYTLSLGKEFKTSFYKDTYARVFVIDEKGNVGRSPFFDTPHKTGHHKIPGSECGDVGPLKMQKLPEDVLNDAEKLHRYLRQESE